MIDQNDLEKSKDGARHFSQNFYEEISFIFILGLGLIPRLIFVYIFPTIPISDFSGIIHFAIELSHSPIAKGYWAWTIFNPGLPLILSILFRLIPGEPATIARWASAIMSGILPLIPFIVWKNVFSLRSRLFTSILLALWPGQIIFSGVVAQDNWVLLPTLLLCALVVRIMVQKSNGYPLLASLLYVSALAIRQEMLIILLPVVAIGALGTNIKKITRNFLVAAGVITFLLTALVVQRGAATGKYSLSTSHFSAALLGSYVPGAGLQWLDSKPYIAANAPELLKNEDELQSESLQLVWAEIRRRPMFQLIRVFSLSLSDILFSFENRLANWSISTSDTLPPENQELANKFMTLFDRPFKYFSSISHVLFIAAIIFLLFNRKMLWISIPLLLVMLLKFGLHAVVVSQSRFYLTTIAIEFLIIGIAINDGMLDLRKKRQTLALLAASGIAFILLVGTVKTAVAYVAKHDDIPQYHYQFPLHLGSFQFECEMKQGRLLSFYHGGNNATISMDFVDDSPTRSKKSRVECTSQAASSTAIQVSLQDSYTNSGQPGEIQQVFFLNGDEVFNHDIVEAAPSFIIRPSPNGKLNFVFELRVLKADQNANWGRTASTQIVLLLVKP